MPTGYTASVADGTVTDLKTFALTLARGMGALVMMRDEPWDAPIPDRFEPSDYHVRRLEELRAERVRLNALTLEEIEAEIKKEQADYEARKVEDRRKHDETRANYNAMIAKVEAWQGSPEGLKGFALQQLRDGRDFDAREPYRFWGTPPEDKPVQWLQDKLDRNAKELEHHAAENGKEIERTEQRNAWIKQLKESLND